MGRSGDVHGRDSRWTCCDREGPTVTYIIAGTGSRSFDDIRIQDDLVDYLREQKILHPDLQVMSGGAEGWDETIAFAAIENDIPLIVCLPNRGYGEHYWRNNSTTGQDRYETFQRMLDGSVEVEYVCRDVYEMFEGRKQHSNFIRNARMVERAQEFAVFNPTSRGTSHCFIRIGAAGLPYRVFE